MKLGPHYLKRYKDIAVLFGKYGQPGLISKFGIETNGDAGPGNADANDLPNDLERLGPTFVKVGQLLSSRADLLPERYLKSLARLQDKVKPFSYREVELIVEEELGTKISKAFSFFDHEPLAAASLGQVHRAALHDGRPVVVKIQRPGIQKQIEEDFAALAEIARLMQRHTDFGRRYQLDKVLNEFATTIAHELDYRREAANLEAVAENMREFPRIRIPRPVNDYTTHKVLTMDYIEGTKVTELSPLTRLDIDGNALAEEVFKAYLKQVLNDGTFHADPHPGNVFLTSDHNIALLDMGMVGHTTPVLQEHLLKLLLAISEGDSDTAGDVAIRISATTEHFDEPQFRHKISHLIAEQQNSKLHELDLGRALLELTRTAGETGLYVPIELTLLGKTLLQLDQIGQILAPDFDPTESIRRNASQLLNRRMKSSMSEGKIYASLLDAKQFLGALPSRLNKILDALGNAELNVKVKPVETQFLVEAAQKVANRITTGLILAALIVGAALLMQVQTTFQIMGYPGLAIICFMAAAFGGAWLVLNILWQDHKSKQRNRR
ncbi:MAG TPA: AarF/UbiB family protein [Verrucomicrobiae bacterium]|nr:AarF/UbiB family protein [Verrucomicrobiae bacterium]